MHEHPWPKTAEALMRSRFAAVRDADAEWLLASWHPSTRPASLGAMRFRGGVAAGQAIGAPGGHRGVAAIRHIGVPGCA